MALRLLLCRGLLCPRADCVPVRVKNGMEGSRRPLGPPPPPMPPMRLDAPSAMSDALESCKHFDVLSCWHRT